MKKSAGVESVYDEEGDNDGASAGAVDAIDHELADDDPLDP